MRGLTEKQVGVRTMIKKQLLGVMYNLQRVRRNNGN